MRTVHVVTCPECGQPFATKRPGSAYLCEKCRDQILHRRAVEKVRKRDIFRGNPDRTVKVISDPAGEFVEAEFPAHEFVDTLKRGYWPYGMVIQCGEIAAIVKGASLERIG